MSERIERAATLTATGGMIGFFGLVLAGIFFPGPLPAWGAVAMGVVWIAAGIFAIRLRRKRAIRPRVATGRGG